MPSRINPVVEELLNDPYIAATGRVKASLSNPELNAPSCMLRVWSGNLASDMAAISHYIRKGAGVKIHFTRENPIPNLPLGKVQWNFWVSPEHQDFSRGTPEQMKYFREISNWLQEAEGWTDYRSIKVEDNMESIETSWLEFIEAALMGQRIMLDLSAIRPAGISSKGVISTGAFGIGDSIDTGFLDVYRWIGEHLSSGDIGSLLKLLGGLCKVLARGGTRKGGIVTTAMHYQNPLIKQYLNYPLTQILGGSKKGIRFDKNILGNSTLCSLVVDKVNSESLMLEKIQDSDLYLNVCVSGDTFVTTTNGKQQVKDLVGTPFVAMVDGVRYPSDHNGFWSNKRQQVVTVRTKGDHAITLTPDHLLLAQFGDFYQGSARFAWIAANSLKPGDNLRIHDHRVPFPGADKEFDPEYLDEVAEVTHDGTQEVFDCTIPRINCFDGNDFFVHNCMGILLRHKASCLISHANAAQCREPKDLVEALCKATKFLCLVHEQWREHAKPHPDLYLPLEDDKQIAVGWLGWANALRQWGVTYQEHVDALEALRKNEDRDIKTKSQEVACGIACYLHIAYEEAAKIARSHGLERAFTIEPNQRCYQDYFDLDGNTTCRNIDPPFSQSQWRDSAVYGDTLIDHGDVETVADIGHDLHQRHWEEWQHIMNKTGMAHAMSFDLYRDIDLDWFEDFVLRSPLVSTYYNMSARVQQSYLDKGSVLNIAECDDEKCVVCGE